MGSKFCEICMFWTILWPSSRKNFCETLNLEISEILDNSLNREKWEEEQKSRDGGQIKTFENWKTVYFYFSTKNMGCPL